VKKTARTRSVERTQAVAGTSTANPGAPR